ncbi:MAG: ABC transporter permease, partial [Leisingera sp.]
MFAGTMCGYWASLYLGGAPWLIAIPVIILAAIAGGGALGGLCGWLKIRFQVNEIISTVMLNYVVVYLLSYLLAGGPWTAEGSTSYHQTPVFAENFHLPLLADGVKLHIGFLLALAAAAFCWVVLKKTPLGSEIRALGFNPTALRFKGVNVTRTVLIVMCLSGALSALAGVSEIFGVNYRLRGDVMAGLGFTGIIVGMNGLKDQLLHPDLIAEFTRAYQMEYNRLAGTIQQDRAKAERELAQVAGKISNIIEAISDGMFHPSMKDKMTALEARKEELEAELQEAQSGAPVLLHPSLAGLYREQVAS